jgi:NTE family protein
VATKRVAIACQGGGTHAAFTWGVLTEILRTQQAWSGSRTGRSRRTGDDFDVVAFSGTSAGALCALAGWYGMAPNTADPECGTVDKAIERLDHLWTSFAAHTPTEWMHNHLAAAALHLSEKGFPVGRSGPYAPWGDLALKGLSLFGARPEYLGFAGLLPSLCPDFASVDWDGVADSRPRVVLGAIEVLSGNFEIFDSDKTLHDLGLVTSPSADDQYNATRWRMRRALSLEGAAASGTLPEVLRAQPIDDLAFPSGEAGGVIRRTGYYWDGLYSQNPPVRDLLDTVDPESKPDEIWVVRINPQEFQPENDRIGLDHIRDRVNALAGNLSLNGELDHIVTMNDWLRRFGDEHPPLAGRKVVAVRTIKMRPETAYGLPYTSKFDRDQRHLAALHDEGQEVARVWLADWRTRGEDFACYPDDARYIDG